MTRHRRRTAGHPALPFSTRFGQAIALRGVFVACAIMLLLSGCGTKPTPPTAPVHTHLEDAVAFLPRILTATAWQRFTFNDWAQLRARAGLGETPVADWTMDPHVKESATLQGWLIPPGSVATAAALAPLGVDAATLHWQAALDGPDNQPVTRLITAAARDDRPKQVGAALASLGYSPVAATPGTQTNQSVVYARGTGVADTLPTLLDSNAAALLATPAAFVTVHDPARVPDAVAASAPNGANLDAVPVFHGLIAGISDTEAMVIFHIGADGYHDATAPSLDAPTLPFDAIGAALHITDAGAQYATLAFHVMALPGGRLPEGMAEWWATRFGLDQPDPRAAYLEAFGNDGWLFARYRILAPDERHGDLPPGELPFWQSVTTWQPIHQRWANFAPHNADPIPRIGT
ncbi:MAG: hypothetical protein M3Y58_09630 [Chloroflexota bacterium]|nr:hypothetical protein [Chloroflexota bacterium]